MIMTALCAWFSLAKPTTPSLPLCGGGLLQFILDFVVEFFKAKQLFIQSSQPGSTAANSRGAGLARQHC